MTNPYSTKAAQVQRDTQITKRLQVYVAILSVIILFGSVIFQQTSIIWERF